MANTSIVKPPITGAELLRFSNVSMEFPDGTEALRGINLAVSHGEFVSIVGPSGCGKSTLLRIAADLTSPTYGDVKTDNTVPAFVFQDPNLLPWRSVRKNVELLLELMEVPKAERSQIVEQCLELVNLGQFADYMPGQLSGGMKMRASLARALTLRTNLFLFDEPFGALDEITRQRLNDELMALFAKESFAGVFVTHSLPEASYLSSRIVVVSSRPGRIVETYEVPFPYPREFSLRYSSEFSEFVGNVSSTLRAAEGVG